MVVANIAFLLLCPTVASVANVALLWPKAERSVVASVVPEGGA